MLNIEELRKCAMDVNSIRATYKAFGPIIDFLNYEIQLAAQQGKYKLTIWLTDLKWNRLEIERSAVELRKNGFVVNVDKDITTYYSNTDWNEEEFISIDWSV